MLLVTLDTKLCCWVSTFTLYRNTEIDFPLHLVSLGAFVSFIVVLKCLNSISCFVVDSHGDELCCSWSSTRNSHGSSIFFAAALSVKVWIYCCDDHYFLIYWIWCDVLIVDSSMQLFDIANVYSLSWNSSFSRISGGWLCKVQVWYFPASKEKHYIIFYWVCCSKIKFVAF